MHASQQIAEAQCDRRQSLPVCRRQTRWILDPLLQLVAQPRQCRALACVQGDDCGIACSGHIIASRKPIMRGGRLGRLRMALTGRRAGIIAVRLPIMRVLI